MDVAGRRVTLMGLGTHGGGLAAARWLAGQGAELTVTDLATAEPLAASLEALHTLPVRKLVLGRHDPDDFLHAQVVVVNPAVRPGDAFVELARSRGARITSEIELFLERCPAPVIGVTGTNGKSTTAALNAAMLCAAGIRTWLGGNIGVSLLGELERITADHWVVLELSSFQLAQLGAGAPRPRIAVITNCSANHLDWHGTVDAYVAAKRQILGCRPECVAVIGEPTNLFGGVSCAFSARQAPPWAIDRLPPLELPGMHNRLNAACAASAAEQAGASHSAIIEAARTFRGLKHRMQFLGERGGRRIFNDAKATTPEATIAALHAIKGPCWLLAGGQENAVDFEPLARCIAERACGAALFGAAREQLYTRIAAVDPGFRAVRCEHLDEALSWCLAQSRAGDTLLLSPACPSHDQFHDFNQRGNRFIRLVADHACAEVASANR